MEDLAPNTKNPRKPFTPDQLAAFRDSLVRFGDLGGIVRNRLTNQLIGGHKRIEAFRAATTVRIVAEPQRKDRQGTVAHGYVLVDGARFGYREVEWSTETEIAANLAANRWTAEWDWRLVADALKTIDDVELRKLTGFADHEMANLMAADWDTPKKGDLMDEGGGGHAIKLNEEQFTLLSTVKAKMDPTSAISDPEAIERLCREWLTPARGAVQGAKHQRRRA